MNYIKNERSAGAVIFRRDGYQIKYLILHYHFKGNYWDFTRGKIETGETEKEAARREIKEETQLSDIEFIDNFRETTNWFYRWKNEDIFKEAVYFLAESNEENVELSDEHVEYKWLNYSDALDTLTYDNTKNILRDAHRMLEEKD